MPEGQYREEGAYLWAAADLAQIPDPTYGPLSTEAGVVPEHQECIYNPKMHKQQKHFLNDYHKI